LAVLILVVALIVILIGAELFTNGIEWVGRKLDLAEGAVGSVLAAVGTALPETMIPIIAILFAGGEASHEVGIGAILGAPFMLSTLAMFVTGVGVLAFRARRSTGEDMRIDAPTLTHDIRYFAIAYSIAVGAAFLPLEPVWLKWIVAVGLILIYAWYVRAHFVADPEVDLEDLAPLRFHRLDARVRSKLKITGGVAAHGDLCRTNGDRDPLAGAFDRQFQITLGRYQRAVANVFPRWILCTVNRDDPVTDFYTRRIGRAVGTHHPDDRSRHRWNAVR